MDRHGQREVVVEEEMQFHSQRYDELARRWERCYELGYIAPRSLVQELLLHLTCCIASELGRKQPRK